MPSSMLSTRLVSVSHRLHLLRLHILLHHFCCADCNGSPGPADTISNQASWSCINTAHGGNCTVGCASGYTGSAVSVCSLGSWSAPTGSCSANSECCLLLMRQAHCRRLHSHTAPCMLLLWHLHTNHSCTTPHLLLHAPRLHWRACCAFC